MSKKRNFLKIIVISCLVYLPICTAVALCIPYAPNLMRVAMVAVMISTYPFAALLKKIALKRGWNV